MECRLLLIVRPLPKTNYKLLVCIILVLETSFCVFTGFKKHETSTAK